MHDLLIGVVFLLMPGLPCYIAIRTRAAAVKGN